MIDCKSCRFDDVCVIPNYARKDLKSCKVYEVKKPQTNADRIRNMSDEELAGIIMCPYDANECLEKTHDCIQCCLEWLQSEAKESE